MVGLREYKCLRQNLCKNLNLRKDPYILVCYLPFVSRYRDSSYQLLLHKCHLQFFISKFQIFLHYQVKMPKELYRLTNKVLFHEDRYLQSLLSKSNLIYRSKKAINDQPDHLLVIIAI